MTTDDPCPDDPVMCSAAALGATTSSLYLEESKDLQAISRWTGALFGCGGYEWDIADFLKKLAEKRGKGA